MPTAIGGLRAYTEYWCRLEFIFKIVNAIARKKITQSPIHARASCAESDPSCQEREKSQKYIGWRRSIAPSTDTSILYRATQECLWDLRSDDWEPIAVFGPGMRLAVQPQVFESGTWAISCE